MNIGVVIPATAGREENLKAVLRCLEEQTVPPAAVAVVDDGGELDHVAAGISSGEDTVSQFDLPGLFVLHQPKHQPGMEQPRNVGVRALRGCNWTEITHAWFLDSDVVVEPDCLEQIYEAYKEDADEQRVMVCPYDWLPPGMRPTPGERFPAEYHQFANDPRWVSFNHHDEGDAVTNDLSAGLACFSGNLVWPIEQFERVGGFWSELHHGRCEDGELGLRAVAMDVPISFAHAARGWHLYHHVNTQLAVERNARDVPMLNARHPWVEGADVFMVDRDGKAFDVRCGGCGALIPTIQWWEHAAMCGVPTELPVR